MLSARIIVFLLSIIIVGQSQVEALWMRYPAISPDGRTIAFTYMGDIYTVPSEGGIATQLTSNPAHDFMPVWDKNSASIAFASDRHGNFDIYRILLSDGQARRLTFHSAHDYPWDFDTDNDKIYFTSSRIDDHKSSSFPSGVLSELYTVPADGGRVIHYLGVPAEEVSNAPGDTYLVYQDRKGYEDPWRKHHKSSVTRDIWMYRKELKTFKNLTHHDAEDREPVVVGNQIFYLSERETNVFNVFVTDSTGKHHNQLTTFRDHPVRFLSASDAGVLCFGWNGKIFTFMKGQEPKEVSIKVPSKDKVTPITKKTFSSEATEYAVSPNGKEIAFVVRGEVFVTSVDHSITKRITDTPEQERGVKFSPDGRKLVYAGERDNSWNIYQAEIANESEEYFHLATTIKEKALVKTEEETFTPKYGPKGKEIAYLLNRTGIQILNLESGQKRTILKPGINYSYSDGDQFFSWSPDGKWIATNYLDNNRWMSDIALIKTDGKSKPINLTESGYNQSRPRWVMRGNALLYVSDRHGKRSQASWGSEVDLYAIFLNEKTFDKVNLPREEYELKYGEKKDKEKEKEKEEVSKSPVNVTVDLDGIKDRVKRLTIHSSSLSGAVLTKDGEKLYYLSKFEKGYDLWRHDLVKNETKLIQKLSGSASSLSISADEKYLFALDQGKILKFEISGDKVEKSNVDFNAVMNLRLAAERRYMFEHAWRQAKDKFYLKELHGVDWEFYKKEYERFLPHISNGYEFSEMLSELLGELNASHTGARFRPNTDGDKSASLGYIPDVTYAGPGIKVGEVLKGGPLDKANLEITEGDILSAINGNPVTSNTNHNEYLLNIEGKPTRLTFRKAGTKETYDAVVRPISLREENDLLYKRWVRRNQDFTEKYSKGKIAYVHVRGMNEDSYRDVYEDLMGKYHDYEGVVVDTRFNGGGWLHDDLATLLSGSEYMKFSPRGQENMGSEPMFKWKQKSIVLMSEGNYSDAHMFPYVYRALNIGKLIGMPVPGTGTAVWWERMVDGETVFGIPQVGMKGNDGKLLENQQLVPDIMVVNKPDQVILGKDEQLKRAIDELMITGDRDH